jgi:hypothetical protein
MGRWASGAGVGVGEGDTVVAAASGEAASLGVAICASPTETEPTDNSANNQPHGGTVTTHLTSLVRRFVEWPRSQNRNVVGLPNCISSLVRKREIVPEWTREPSRTPFLPDVRPFPLWNEEWCSPPVPPSEHRGDLCSLCRGRREPCSPRSTIPWPRGDLLGER